MHYSYRYWNGEIHSKKDNNILSNGSCNKQILFLKMLKKISSIRYRAALTKPTFSVLSVISAESIKMCA